MAVSAKKLDNRDVYEIEYDPGDSVGNIVATFENPENGDKSTYKGANDGKFVVTVATGYQGTDEVTIVNDDGVVDGGTVTFGG